MAKSKKSKILAMALCAGVMAGIYASPVMAAQTGLKISSGNIEAENSVVINGVTMTDGRLGVKYGIFAKTLNINGYKFTVDELGNTVSKGDVTSTAADGTTYTLNTVGNNTSGITKSDEKVTTIEGAFSVNENGYIYNKNGSFRVTRDGAITASSYNGVTLATNGNQVLVGDIDVNDLKDKTQYMYHAATNTTGFKGAVNVEGNIRSTYGGFVIGDGSTALHKGNLELDGEVLSSAKLGTINDVIDADGNVKGTTVTTAAGADLDVVNGRTKNMTTIGSTTVFNNKVAINDAGISMPGENGATGIMIGSDGTIYSQNGMSTSGDFETEAGYTLNTVGADLDALETNVGNISGNVAGIKRDNANLPYEEGRTEIEGVVAVNGKDGRFYVLGEDGTQAAVITNDGIARFGFENEKHVRLENGELKINDANKNTVASLSENGLTLGLENLNEEQLSNINNVIGEGGVVTAADGSVIGGVGFTSGAMTDVVSINGAAVEGVGNGGLKISGVELENGLINGVNINDLDKAVAGTSANIGGIEREAEDGAASGEGTTTIENNLKVSGDKINMFGDTGLTFDEGTMNGVNVISVSGNIGFNGSNVHFSYGSDGKTTTLGGLALTVDQIATDVSAIKEKTDHITVDDKGNVTISADDGSSLTVGKDGTSTGQGGQVTTDGNHTVNGDLDVDGSGQIDKDLTVGGDLEVGGSITTGNTTIDGSGMTVGDGTTITDGKVSSTEGAFGNINSNTGTIGNATFGKDNTIFGTGDNQTTINNDGVTVGGEEGTSIKHDEISVGDGGYIGGGDVVSGEGVSLNQTAERVGELEDRIDKVGAMAAAIANLRTMGYDPAAPTEVAVGIGQYRDETGAALGLFHYPNRDFMLSLSVSTSGDEVMGGIGATWKFGRKSPEKVAEIKKAQAEADARRAEEAKLAKAEEMKQAAKEAKIKAQQERHAKLAAERAAQAEAAK